LDDQLVVVREFFERQGIALGIGAVHEAPWP
jgi:hypothetical protein